MLKPAVLCWTLCSALWSSLLAATEMYRYIDERGVTVIDRLGVPPEHVARGYEVLNEQGRIEYSNPFLRQMTGYSEAELLGQWNNPLRIVQVA